MEEVKDGSDFFCILKGKDAALASILENIKKKGLDDWVNMLIPELGSHSGYPHLCNVERIANKIIPYEVKKTFSAGEIFLLLSAIFLHDIGKTNPHASQTYPRCKNEPDCKNKEDGHPLCRELKWSHFAMSREIIENRGMALGLPDERIAEYCGLIVFCHGLRIPPNVSQKVLPKKYICPGEWDEQSLYRTTSLDPYGELRIPLLASILRIADETDDSWTRAYREYWSKSRNKDELKKFFRNYIEDVEFCHEGRCLIIHVPDLENAGIEETQWKDYIDRISNVENEIFSVIQNWSSELEKIGVKFDSVYFEYKNHLVIDFNRAINENYFPKLNEVIGKENKDGTTQEVVEPLFDAMSKLVLGSFGYPGFSWKIFEAQVGRPLTEMDHWLVGKIADASENQIVINEKNEIRITPKSGGMKSLRSLIIK